MKNGLEKVVKEAGKEMIWTLRVAVVKRQPSRMTNEVLSCCPAEREGRMGC